MFCKGMKKAVVFFTLVLLGTVYMADVSISTVNATEGSLVIPERVRDNSYYEQLKATGKMVSESEASNILKNVGKGRTGDKLDFSPDTYPYYSCLNETQKTLYRQIYANANALNRRFSLNADAYENDVSTAFSALMYDHPELFWLENGYKYIYAPDGRVAEMTTYYNISANDILGAKADIEKAADDIAKGTYGLYTDYEKEQKVHDILLERVKFDANAPMNDSAYSALAYGRSASAGYARAYQYVLQRMGIPCYFVNGYTDAPHAWNIIGLDDGYYNVDTAWDDAVSSYAYFNRPDGAFEASHERRGLSKSLPECDSGLSHEGARYASDAVNADTVKNTAKDEAEVSQNNVQPNTQNRQENVQPPKNTADSTTSTVTTVTTGNTTATITQTEGETITVTSYFHPGYNDYIGSLRDYYNECFDRLMKSNGGSANFDIIVNDKGLWDDIYYDYLHGGYEEGYTLRFLAEKHMDNLKVNVTGIPRSDGSYLVKHSVSIW